ncbi:hypothetical protein, partial [Pseudomonas juntendi]
EMSHLIRPSFSALNTSEKLDRQQSIYVCFGPIIPVGFARERFGAWLDIVSYEQGGRARLSQASLARNKRRSERQLAMRRAGGARSYRRRSCCGEQSGHP